MEKTLIKLCNLFDDHNIRFGIGASLLLKSYGIVDKASDIDLIVHIDDVKQVQELMDKMGVVQKSSDTTLYFSEVFLEYNVEGVDVDIMSNFTIKTGEDFYVYPFCVEEIQRRGEAQLPYLSLREWEKAYRLMGRIWKADLVLDYLEKRNS